MKWRISDWPFSLSDQVRLHWMRSPRMVGDEKQWMMTAVFRRQNGELVDVDVPWGMLPALQLGQLYQGGIITDDTCTMERTDYRFPTKVTCEIRRAVDVLPRSLYPLMTYRNLDERCVRISFGNHVLVIPCLEVIRAFYCPNRTLAEAILTPSGITDLVKANHDGGILRLKFDQKVPYSMLRSKYTVALIGQILTNNDWNERWKLVWHSRPNNSDTEQTIPVTCEPPILEGSRWAVLGYSWGSLSLVVRILGTESPTSFPFSKILFSHPNSKGREVHFGSSNQVLASSFLNEEVEIQREPTSPTGINRPVVVGSEVSLHLDLSKTEIHEVGAKSGSGTDKDSGDFAVVKYTHVAKSEPKSVSFYEEGGHGTMAAGEFKPLVPLEDILLPESMMPFFRAIEGMKLQYSYDVGYVIRHIPQESPISQTMDHVKRLYALVEVHWLNMKAYILEVDNQDGHSMSTLLYTHHHDPADPLKVAARLFNEFVTSQGSWDRASIDALMGNHYVLARHRKSDAWTWSHRLAGKVNRLLRQTNPV